jgi:FkbM family methyltransferase
MLIPFTQINNVLKINNIECKGALHLGAHECEEIPFYSQIGVLAKDIVWIDAIPTKVEEARARGVPNVHNAVITDKDDEDVVFNVSNNGQSSSVLEFGTHKTEHPWVVYVDKLKQKSVTLDTFIERNRIDATKLTFWNFDIQGAELMALRGATKYIQYAKVMYLEVNEKELYKGCGLIDDIDAFLASYKFKRVLTKMTDHGWGDAMYVLSE